MGTVPTRVFDPDAAEIERIRAEYLRREAVLPDARNPLVAVNQFYHSQTSRACIKALGSAGMLPLNCKRIGDVGCGAGLWLLDFLRWGARCEDLHGIDLSEARISEAKQRLPHADLQCGDARHLPWADASMDLVSQFTLFTSILSEPVRYVVAREMLRVVKPSGVILWYDFCFNHPGNPNVRGVTTNEIRALFAGCDVDARRVTLAPPIARRVVPYSWPGALMLESIPLLRTHCLAVIRPRQERA